MTVRNLMDDMAEFVKLGYGDFEIKLEESDNDIRYHITRDPKTPGDKGTIIVEHKGDDIHE